MTERGGTNVLAANEALALEPEEHTIPAVGPRWPSRPITGSVAQSSLASRQDESSGLFFFVFQFVDGFSTLLNISLCEKFLNIFSEHIKLFANTRSKN